MSQDGPLPGPGDSVTFTHDAVGRLQTITTPDGYTTTNSYDNLDRPTGIAYPDGTSMAFTYDKLDRVKVRDRLGRETSFAYDALDRLTSVQDPLNRVTRFEYCNCGSVSAVIDAFGRPTHWQYDLEGRVLTKQYADGSTVNFTYDGSSSRMTSVRDAKGQVTAFAYGVDDNLTQVTYPVAQAATPAVTFTYDANYSRLVAMQDGIGATTYTYNPPGVPGALQPAVVNGPWANDTITYQYDSLGRSTSRAINGVAQTCAYDAMGRPTNVVNVLGSFAYDYDGATGRLLDALYPNGQTTHYDYFNVAGDTRLQHITHLKPDTTKISRFSYLYNAAGSITNWVQELGSLTNVWAIGYDSASQLASVQDTQNASPTNYAYGYDPAGNRVSATAGSTNVNFQYNALNELVSAAPVSQTNGLYEWDAEDRLTAVTLGALRSEFGYDGLSRRCRIVEKSNGVVQAETHYV